MKRFLLRPELIVFAVLIVPFLSLACQKDVTIADTTMAQEQVTSEPGAPVAVPPIRKDGARAWAQNCMRCHNVRDPQERSDREWKIIVHHMRVRANLTADEHRLILEFLKAAN
jgi:cytochrome c5